VRYLALAFIMMVMMNLPSYGADTPLHESGLTLRQAIELGVEYSPRLKAARADIKASRAETGEARSRLAPGLSLNGIYSTGNMPMIVSTVPIISPGNTVSLGNNTSGDLSAVLMAPLYTGGSLNENVRARERDEAAAAWEEQRVRLELVMDIKSSYLQALYLDESRKAYDELLELQNENVKRSEMLLKAGKIPLLYLLRSKNEKAVAESTINRLKASFEAERASLMALLGGDTRSAPELSEAFTLWETPGDRDALLAELDHHPILKRLDEKVAAAYREIHSIEGEYLPQVYFFGMGEAVRPAGPGPNPGFTTGITAGVALADGGARKSRVEKILARLENLGAERDTARLTLEKELIAGYQVMEAEEKNAKLADAALAEALEVLRITALRYQSGKGISLEIIDAQWNQAKARLMRLEAIKAHNIAVARIKYVMGTW
jgi:outer membrane protein